MVILFLTDHVLAESARMLMWPSIADVQSIGSVTCYQLWTATKLDTVCSCCLCHEVSVSAGITTEQLTSKHAEWRLF